MRKVSKADLLELLLHPVRIRIVHAFSGARMRTTSELCARLPDISQATVYRHVGLLARAGVLQAAGEKQVRGAVERTYRLDRTRAVIGKDAANMSREDHRRAFAAAMGALLADFGAYLDHIDAEPASDLVGYRQIPLWLSPPELRKLIANLRRVIETATSNGPRKGRSHYLLSPILFPIR